jgi:hypothetical protein
MFAGEMTKEMLLKNIAHDLQKFADRAQCCYLYQPEPVVC